MNFEDGAECIVSNDSRYIENIFAKCYSLPLPSNGLDQGHVPDIVKPLLNLCTKREKKKLTMKNSIKAFDGGDLG